MPRSEENRDKHLARIIAQTLATTPAAKATTSNAPRNLQAPRMVRLKLDNPVKFDGKQKTPFRTWWNSLRDYIRIMAPCKSVPSGKWTKEWNTYLDAIQGEYLEPQEAAIAFNQLSALRYKGDIKAYLTALRALNIHARVMGEALQNKVNLALPLKIIDRRLAQNPCWFTEDEPS